jgi:hypothetical protein
MKLHASKKLHPQCITAKRCYFFLAPDFFSIDFFFAAGFAAAFFFAATLDSPPIADLLHAICMKGKIFMRFRHAQIGLSLSFVFLLLKTQSKSLYFSYFSDLPRCAQFAFRKSSALSNYSKGRRRSPRSSTRDHCSVSFG